MSDTTYPIRAAARRPRLQTETGIRLIEPVDGYEGVAARGVHYSDGYTSAYIGAVYREGHGRWLAFGAEWNKVLDDVRLIPTGPGHALTFRSQSLAVAAVVAHAGIVL